MNNPSTIAKIWDIAPPNSSAHARWSTHYDPNLSVFQDLLRSGAHALVVVSLGAVVGGLLLILFINHLNRKRLQWGGFLALFVIFIILGASFKSIVQTPFHGVAITLYVFSQITFNFGKFAPCRCHTHPQKQRQADFPPHLTGPNSLTFIVRNPPPVSPLPYSIGHQSDIHTLIQIPAKLFPTRYRASCHGISAAAGKFGSVIVQLFLAYVKFDDRGNNDPRSLWLGDVLIMYPPPSPPSPLHPPPLHPSTHSTNPQT
jgi:PHS family inorganic phosphate transporter-like MFS transporter